MSSEYSDDQYRADYDSRYPQFSDYQVSDTMIAEHKWDRPAKSRGVNTYESLYQTEQIGLPAYMGCRCGKCTESAWPRSIPLRRPSLDETVGANRCLQSAPVAQPPAAPIVAQPPAAPIVAPGAAPVQSGASVESMHGGHHMHLDPTTIMLVLTFIMFVFICYCMKSIIEIKAQLKKQKNDVGK